MKSIIIICIASLIGFGKLSHAADANGNFSIEGAGVAPCKRVTQAFKEQGKEYFIYGGWIEGYISAVNATREDTFDMTPWQSTQLVYYAVTQYCSNNNNANLHNAVSQVVNSLQEERIIKGGKFVAIQVGKQKTVLQESIIKRIQQKLLELKLYNANLDGDFTDKLKESIKAYQKSLELEANGFPDQRTLLKLFASATKK